MFFDEENCSAIRMLTEIGEFLEASIEKLLVLEKETLLEIEKSKKEGQSEIKIKEEPIEEVQTEDVGSRNIVKNSGDTPIQNDESECEDGSIHFENNNSSPSTSKSLKRKLDIDPSSDLSDGKTRKSAKCFSKSICIKHEHNRTLEDVEVSFSSATSSKLVEHLNLCSSTMTPDNLNSSVRVKKELGTCHVCTSDTRNHVLMENSMVEPGSVALDNSDLSKTAYIIREHDFFKARIRFKKCFTYNVVYELLTKAGITDIDDIAIVQKNAIVAFLSESKLKTLLDLNNKSGLKKIKAFCVEPYKKYKVIEEKAQSSKKKHKKKWK